MDAKSFHGFGKDLMNLEMKNLKYHLWLRKCFVSQLAISSENILGKCDYVLSVSLYSSLDVCCWQ